MNLFELVGQWDKLMELAEDPDIEEDVLQDTMDALQGEIEVKADGYAYVISNLKVKIGALDGMIKAIEKTLEDLKAKKKALENNIERMKRALCLAMKAIDRPKIKTDHFSFWIQQTPPATIIDDDKAVPEKYLIPQEPKIDKEGIKKAIQNGEKLNFAHLETHDSLRFR